MKFWEAMKALEEGKSVINYHLGSSMGVKSPFHSFFRDDWRVVEEPEQTLSFAEVVKGLKEGKKFRRRGWKEDRTAIHMGYYASYIWNESQVISGFTVEDFEATDWVEVK